MELFTELAAALHLALSIWDSKEKNKYRDQLVDLENKRDAEKRRTDDEGKPAVRMSVLDDLERQLVMLRRSIGAAAGSGSKVEA